MKPIHKRRLRKLIAFLRRLPRKRFNFGVVRNETSCGAVACAIGWMPNVFPRVFKPVSAIPCIHWTHEVTFRGEKYTFFYDIAEWLTGLERARNLFYPSCQKIVDDRLPNLPKTASPKQVAAMLEKFIRIQEQDAKRK